MRTVLSTAAVLMCGLAMGSVAQQQPAPIERRPPHSAVDTQRPATPHPSMPSVPYSPDARTHLKGEHLTEWMNAHSNLTPQQQQQALEREPGFHDLPPSTQQRIRDRLSQLDAMPPDLRQRTMQHTEQMERLEPQQRADVRSAMLQLSALPPEQRRMVSHAFRELRGMPPEERIRALNSGRFQYLNDRQRSTLDQLMEVEPLLPPQGR